MQRVCREQGANRGTADDQEFGGLQEDEDWSLLHEKAAQHGSDHDNDSDDCKHVRSSSVGRTPAWSYFRTIVRAGTCCISIGIALSGFQTPKSYLGDVLAKIWGSRNRRRMDRIYCSDIELNCEKPLWR